MFATETFIVSKISAMCALNDVVSVSFIHSIGVIVLGICGLANDIDVFTGGCGVFIPCIFVSKVF